jgi:YVTN family beta-propeller protein
LVYNSLNNKVYSANWGSGNVTVINGSSNSVIKTVPAGSRPYALAYNSLNNKVYCANKNSENVTVIDGASDSVVATITVESGPYALGYNFLNNKVYCVNSNSSTVTVIDGASDTVIKTIPVGYVPRAIAYNSNNNKVYCANAGQAGYHFDSTVTVIDGVSDTVIKTITDGSGPRAFAWNPIDNRIYVANYWSNTVSVIKDTILIGIEETTNPNPISLTPEIYPNPARSFLAVRLPSTADRQAIKIFDVSGKLVKVTDNVTTAQEHKQEIKISLKGINPGIYFLQVGKEVKKLLVVK